MGESVRRWVLPGSVSTAFHFLFLLLAFLLTPPERETVIPIKVEIRRAQPPVPIGAPAKVNKRVRVRLRPGLSPPLPIKSAIEKVPLGEMKSDERIAVEEALVPLASSDASSEFVVPVEEEVRPLESSDVPSVGPRVDSSLPGGLGTEGAGAPVGPVYIPLTEVTRMPGFKTKAAPVYPEQARQLEKEGVVTLEVSISEKGSVLDVVVVQRAGFGFDEAAIEAIKKSHFEPAYVGDQPVAVIVRLPIRFRFRD